MKTWTVTVAGLAIAGCLSLAAFVPSEKVKEKPRRLAASGIPKGCVFRTVMGEESAAGSGSYKTPEHVQRAVNQGLEWIVGAQHNNGGWGAGSHSRQDVRDPHAVPSDPATTAMVAMAILRSGSTLTGGTYSKQLRQALEFILRAAEQSESSSFTITDVTGTQIQTKLGANIDVILASQFLSNIIDYATHDIALKNRVKRAQEICVRKIQRAQDGNGSINGSGWAGVLQSSLATTALESAQAKGANVDEDKLNKAREFQKNNYNAETGDVNTDMGAGVVLYSVTGSARSSAKEARRVEEEVRKAKAEGKLAQSEAPSAVALEKLGYSKDDAIRYATAYEVYQSAKVQAQRDDVMDGFGSNGGEEFISYLQTGESMVINKDDAWKKWYDNMAGRLLKIQNDDGSWSGHHCITSPVFCTATCLLILSINEDIDNLVDLGR